MHLFSGSSNLTFGKTEQFASTGKQFLANIWHLSATTGTHFVEHTAKQFGGVGLQIYKMINLGSNVIVYKLKHCVLHFEVNMMTF